MGRGVDNKGATQGNLGGDETVVGKCMTMCFSKPIQLCNTKSELHRIQVKKKHINQGVRDTKDGIQTVKNDSNCITDEWHRVKGIWKNWL